MSDKMLPITFEKMLDWILLEYANHKSIFGIPAEKFHRSKKENAQNYLGSSLETPVGPAAGPHTQMAQNILSAYLCGARFFELKTVQIMDDLELQKPCIDANDEGYNIEWSQELKLEQSFDEYLKAWVLVHFIKNLVALSGSERGFIFNMSIGYTLEGIQNERMDQFIELLKDASKCDLFEGYISILKNKLDEPPVKELIINNFDYTPDKIDKLIESLNHISPEISNSVTLSTMHGCPPYEIEAIAKYLMEEKKLHTYVKLNPTLLGYDFVESILSNLGYDYIKLTRESFEHDLQFEDAIPMLNRLVDTAAQNELHFGIKLSNTLGVKNTLNVLDGKEMYMSGRALFPLTINLAGRLSKEFDGKISISYSGGANTSNINKIIQCGLMPVTIATDLLKPGGYLRLLQIVNDMDSINAPNEKIDVKKLEELANESLSDKNYFKEKREISTIKIQKSLPLTDCYIAPCQEACPIHQDVASYIKLVEEKRYEEAFKLIVSNNPLPHITSFICDHQCMYHCTRWDYDDPVLIRDLKKEAALNGYNSYLNNLSTDSAVTKNNIHVAVIGAGPSGLSAAYFLSKAGFDVTIFDKEMNAGGIVQNILPRFRLPKEAIEKDIELIEKQGIRFVFGANPDIPLSQLKREGYKYIYIGIGAELSNKFSFESDSQNVFDALVLLKDYHKEQNISLGKSVAVIGGGNSAMDAARASIRYSGVEKVYLIYRRTKNEMPADKEEFYAALNDGVEFKELLLPVKFQNGILTCQKMKLDQIGSDGRRSALAIENEFEEVRIDSVVTAIGEHVDKDYLHRNKIRMAHNSAVVNAFNETDVQNVFIGGDALRGPSTVVESIADGKKAAEAIIKKEQISIQNESPIKYFENDADLITDFNTRKGKVVAQEKSDSHKEATRCLGCNYICNKCVEVCPNRANVAIKSNSDFFKDQFQILHIDALCNECGNCETFCPYHGAPYKEKPILFPSEKDFNDSRKNGFFITEYNNQKIMYIRWKSEKGAVTCDIEGNIIKSSYFEQQEILSVIEWIKSICKDYPYLL